MKIKINPKNTVDNQQIMETIQLEPKHTINKKFTNTTYDPLIHGPYPFFIDKKEMIDW